MRRRFARCCSHAHCDHGGNAAYFPRGNPPPSNSMWPKRRFSPSHAAAIVLTRLGPADAAAYRSFRICNRGGALSGRTDRKRVGRTDYRPVDRSARRSLTRDCMSRSHARARRLLSRARRGAVQRGCRDEYHPHPTGNRIERSADPIPLLQLGSGQSQRSDFGRSLPQTALLSGHGPPLRDETAERLQTWSRTL